MNTWLLLLLSSLLTCSGQLLQKHAAVQLAADRWALRRVLGNRHLQLAIACLAAGAGVWLLVLQRIDVGLAYPMLGINFVWITFAAAFWFRESTDMRHWLGVSCIVAGVILLGVSA